MKAAWFLRTWPVGETMNMHHAAVSDLTYYHPLQRRYSMRNDRRFKTKIIQWVTLARVVRCQHADEKREKGKKRFSNALTQTLTAARKNSSQITPETALKSSRRFVLGKPGRGQIYRKLLKLNIKAGVEWKTDPPRWHLFNKTETRCTCRLT